MKNKIFKSISLFLFFLLLSGFRNNIAFKKSQQAKLAFITTAQNIYTGNCSDAATVQTQSPSGAAQNVGSNLTVNLATTGSLQFYSDSSCASPITSVTISSGTSSKSFYFILSVAGSETITASASGYSSAAQSQSATANPFIWTGAGGNVNWNNGANWSGGVSPSSTSHYALFNSSCSSNCSPTINVSISVGGIRVNSGYAGTITLGSGNSLTIASKGWIQAAGTFQGGNGSIILNGSSAIVAGTFVATSGTMTFNKAFAMTGGTFTHNSGKVVFAGTSYPTIYSLNGMTFNNVDFIQNAWGNLDLAGMTFTVNGTLKLESFVGCSNNCTMDNGTINAKGNVNIVNDGFYGQTATIKINGSANQSIDASLASPAGRLPSLEIASTGGTVSFVGTVGINKNYTYTSGTVSAGTSTLAFLGADQNITPGTVSYYNVTMSNPNWQQKSLMGGTMTVANDLSLSSADGCGGWCKLDNGTINVGRHVNISSGGYRGTAVINMNGSSNATYTISGTSSIPTGSVTVNKSSSTATVTLASNMPLNSSGQALTITSGILDLAGFTLSVNSALTIGGSGSLLCNGGSYTSGSLVNSGTIDCASYPFNWTGAGGNANWNTAANWSGGVVPNSSQVAIFKNSYCSQCSATINVDPNVKGLRMLAPFTGTLTQSAGIVVTVGSGGWVQQDGTFTGNNAAINISYHFSLTGGTFTSTTNTFTTQNNFTQTGTSTFNANGGTLKTSGLSTLTIDTATLNHLYIDSSYSTATVNGTINVNGNFTYGTSTCCGITLNAGVAPGEINVYGNATNNLPAGYGSGTAKVKIVGSGTQTVTGTYGGSFPNFTIASSGTVNLVGTIATQNFIHSSGTVNAGTSTVVVNGGSITTNGMNFKNLIIDSFNPVANGTITVDGNLILGTSSSSSIYVNAGTAPGIVEVKGNVTTSGYDGYGGGTAKVKLIGTGNQTVTGSSGYLPVFEVANTGGGTITLVGTVKASGNFTFTSAGALVATGSTMSFTPQDYSAVTIIPGGFTYNNVRFDSRSTFTLSGTVNSSGNLVINSNGAAAVLNSGTLNVQGNLSATNYGATGTTAINFSGNTNSTVTLGALASFPRGAVTVNKNLTTNLVSLAANASFPGASQDLTITTGTIDMAGFNLSVGRNISNSDTLKRGNNPSCGTVSYGGSYSGNAAICP